jgi:hypothetical protein
LLSPYAADAVFSKQARYVKGVSISIFSNFPRFSCESAIQANLQGVETMRHDIIEGGGLSYAPCRYGMSRIFFRGPKRNLDSPYLAFLGGTETFGKFIDRPFPVLIEKELRRTCVNFGCVNGGVDAFVNDPTIMAACHEADVTIVQAMGANYLSNRFYSVHPRRNDRFLHASTVLQAIYKEVDFSDYTFTRHMLGALYEMSRARFDIVVSELRASWVARMRNMLGQIGKRSILLWFSREELTDQPWQTREKPLSIDPLFITKTMMDGLSDLVLSTVVARPSDIALSQGTTGMYFPLMQAKAAADMLSVNSHIEASAKLVPKIRDGLSTFYKM